MKQKFPFSYAYRVRMPHAYRSNHYCTATDTTGSLVHMYYSTTYVLTSREHIVTVSGYSFSKSPSGRSSISTPTPPPYTLTACNGCSACKVRMPIYRGDTGCRSLGVISYYGHRHWIRSFLSKVSVRTRPRT